MGVRETRAQEEKTANAKVQQVTCPLSAAAGGTGELPV